jgi:hypothetical protein
MNGYTVLNAGQARGSLTFLSEPLSMWGGYDAGTGRVIDVSHPQIGETLTGKIVVMPFGRGSSSASSVLAESIRLETAPAGFILDKPDPILGIGAMVAKHLYNRDCPILVGPAPSPISGMWMIDGGKLAILHED